MDRSVNLKQFLKISWTNIIEVIELIAILWAHENATKFIYEDIMTGFASFIINMKKPRSLPANISLFEV